MTAFICINVNTILKTHISKTTYITKCGMGLIRWTDQRTWGLAIYGWFAAKSGVGLRRATRTRARTQLGWDRHPCR
jgi:hypothetical protein